MLKLSGGAINKRMNAATIAITKAHIVKQKPNGVLKKKSFILTLSSYASPAHRHLVAVCRLRLNTWLMELHV
jgi:hypothetical protein